eukprot:GGOE01014171.1.p1 GENE.GGOE01014171.1~~GGOE01014171.1.p1  ORF type:complete len:372 (-),score=22.16 GGOE01014171.1:143-1258(-)
MLHSPNAAARRRHAANRASPSSESSKRSQIVIEIGVAFTKCGVAREGAPRACFPTPSNISLLLTQWPTHFVEEELCRDISEYLHLVVFQKLCYPIAGRVVVLCWNANSNERILFIITKLLVDTFLVKAVNPICTQLCALYPTESMTGLVLDCGRYETRCVAIEHSVPLVAQARYVALGAEDVLQAIRHQILEHKPKQGGQPLTDDMLQEIFEKAEAGKSAGTSSSALDVDLPSCLDVLFDPSLHLEDWCITTPLLEVLLACPTVRRAAVAQNIVVCGSLADLPGFHKRVMHSVIQLCRGQRRYAELQGLLKHMSLSVPSVPAQHLAWTGASLAASLAVMSTPSSSASHKAGGHAHVSGYGGTALAAFRSGS